MISLRSRYVFTPIVFALLTLILLSLRFSLGPISSEPPPPPPPAEKVKKFKPAKDPPPPPLPEYFPLAANASSPADIPPVPSWNRPPTPHVPETTRLYIGFTRYWPLLQQVVLSYIAGGWPPEDIYVVENTGTFDANKRGLLTSQNPFYMDYKRLTEVFGVNVITMPSLQTFAQLQNFYLSEAINNNLQYYFWGHMDVVLVPHEEKEPYRSLYQIAVDTIRESQEDDFERDPETGKKKMWAIRFFAYDWFALVNAEAYQKVGGWDSMIGYYGTDCDMHSRLRMNELVSPIADAAEVYDVSRSLDDLELLFRRRKKTSGSSEGSGAEGTSRLVKNDLGAELERRTWGEGNSTSQPSLEKKDEQTTSDSDKLSDEHKASSFLPHSSSSSSSSSSASPSTPEIKAYLDETEEDTRGGPAYQKLKDMLEGMAKEKRDDPYRNSWQLKQRGGQGEPYYYDADGWEKALQMTIEAGVKINEEKWGHRGCDLVGEGKRKEGEQWMLEHDWE